MYNHNGNLGKEIMYRDIAPVVENINPREALKILKGLEEKGSEIRNPTAWIKKAAMAVGPDCELKVKQTISWYNKHGGLVEEIRYDEVRKVLAFLPLDAQFEILKGLDGKGQTIKNPTSWICAAARKWDGSSGSGKGGGRGESYGKGGYGKGSRGKGSYASSGQGGSKVQKTIGWYNKNGNLQQPIHFDTVAPAFQAIGEAAALGVLKGLEEKSSQIRDPTAWLVKACERLATQ